MITRRSFFAAGGSALVLAGCETAQVTADGRFPIMDVLGIMPDVSDFRSALRRAELAEFLNGPGPFTVFAPTNLAWSAAPAAFKDGGAASLRSLIAGGRLRLPDIQARVAGIVVTAGMRLGALARGWRGPGGGGEGEEERPRRTTSRRRGPGARRQASRPRSCGRTSCAATASSMSSAGG